jgi:hypothetical protein
MIQSNAMDGFAREGKTEMSGGAPVETAISADPKLAELVRRLADALHPERIYLFGSPARGDDRRERANPRTHDGGALVDRCVAVDPGFTARGRLADGLTPFAVSVRYIRMYPGRSPEFASLALQRAQQIVAFVESRSSPEVTR